MSECQETRFACLTKSDPVRLRRLMAPLPRIQTEINRILIKRVPVPRGVDSASGLMGSRAARGMERGNHKPAVQWTRSGSRRDADREPSPPTSERLAGA